MDRVDQPQPGRDLRPLQLGHLVRDGRVAQTFLSYWAILASDPTDAPLQTWVSGNNPFDEVTLDTVGVHALFSPRTEVAPLDWYARGFAAAASSTHITLPFGMDNTHFEPLLAHAPRTGHSVRPAGPQGRPPGHLGAPSDPSWSRSAPKATRTP